MKFIYCWYSRDKIAFWQLKCLILVYVLSFDESSKRGLWPRHSRNRQYIPVSVFFLLCGIFYMVIIVIDRIYGRYARKHWHYPGKTHSLNNTISSSQYQDTTLFKNDKVATNKTSMLKKKATTIIFWLSDCCQEIDIQGPVVQSVVSLTSSLRVISLTVLADSIHNILIFFAEKMWVAFAMQKLLTFFQQKISAYLRITRCKF